MNNNIAKIANAKNIIAKIANATNAIAKIADNDNEYDYDYDNDINIKETSPKGEAKKKDFFGSLVPLTFEKGILSVDTAGT